MAPKVQIVFTNSDKTFYPGELVAGRIKISTSREIKCRGLLTCEGLGYVHLKGVQNRQAKLDEGYSAKELYFMLQIRIIGGDNPKETLTLKTGEHSFDFQFQLPTNIPASLEFKYGFVRYSCEATLELHRSLTQNVKCIEIINLNSLVDLGDLRYQTAFRGPVAKYVEKEVKYMFGKTGLLSAVVKIGRAAYVPDEDLIIDVDIKNTSKKVLSMVRAQLIQEITYKVNNHSMTKHNIIGSVVKKHLPGSISNFDWQNEKLKIPQVPPSYLLGCNIIDIQYILRFQVISKSVTPATELEVNIPLIIGSFSPLNDKQIRPTERKAIIPATAPEYDMDQCEGVPSRYDYTKGVEFVEPSAPPDASTSRLYPDINPPSYEESVTESKYPLE